MIKFDPAKLLQALCAARVEFVLIGGIAATVHGLARATYDLDLCYKRTPANCEALEKALAPFEPYLRELPPGLPFSLTKETLLNGMNFTLATTAGDLDLLGEVPGATGYDDLVAHSIRLSAYACEFLCVDLEMLVRLKKAAGRAKDMEVLAQLEVLQKNLGSQKA